MPYTNYHPVYLALTSRPVLIVGGGPVAVEKLQSLLSSRARITVVSPNVCDEIRDWNDEGALTWVNRKFRPTDIDDAFAVIAASDNPELNAWIFELGEKARKLTNSVDDPDHCNFIMAAIARSGPMQVAISSAGCSPALAQRVRNRIESEVLTEDLGKLAEYLGDRRRAVKDCLPTYKARQSFWEQLIDSNLPHVLAAEGSEAADALFQSMLLKIAHSLSPYAGKNHPATTATPGSGQNSNTPSLQPPAYKNYPANAATSGSDQYSNTLVLHHSSSLPEPSEVDPKKVYLVGAGPGDPGLITVRAVEILRKANVVIYDRLVNPILLGYAPESAECIYAGKDRGSPQGARQGSIHAQLIHHARQGKLVVRLKGGDPFVFGRGGEEALALASAGIEFEVVPGVSSAVAAAEAANIPITHRGVSAAFAVFAGHEAEDGPGDSIPWKAAASIPTAVFLMGVERLPLIVSRLIEEGRPPNTPIAIVSNATLSNQEVVVGCLDTIVELAVGVHPPAAIVVGDVVRIREQLRALLAANVGNMTVAA